MSLSSSLPVTVPLLHQQKIAVTKLCQNCLNVFVFLPLADVLRFDNTYSFIHAKKVSFTVEVLLPDKASEEKMKQLGEATPK